MSAAPNNVLKINAAQLGSKFDRLFQTKKQRACEKLNAGSLEPPAAVLKATTP